MNAYSYVFEYGGVFRNAELLLSKRPSVLQVLHILCFSDSLFALKVLLLSCVERKEGLSTAKWTERRKVITEWVRVTSSSAMPWGWRLYRNVCIDESTAALFLQHSLTEGSDTAQQLTFDPLCKCYIQSCLTSVNRDMSVCESPPVLLSCK